MTDWRDRVLEGSKDRGFGNQSFYYPDFSPKEEVPEGGLWDFFEGGFKGYLSGMTWGASELVTHDTPWQDMTAWEKTGWVIGEGASLFNPLGPFGLMSQGLGKAGRIAGNRKIGRATKQGIARATGALAKKEADEFTRVATERASKMWGGATTKNISKAKDQLNKSIRQEVDKTVKGDIGSSWIREINLAGAKGVEAAEQLGSITRQAIKSAYKKAGIEVSDEIAENASKQILKDLTGGKRFVNDFADLVERGFAGAMPGAIRKNTGRYLGMAAQDMVMMTTHSLVANRFKTWANGEEMKPMDDIGHSFYMALAFPLIRAIPGGGRDSWRNGVGSMFNRFKKTDYNKMNEEDLGNLAIVMARGAKLDLWNHSAVGNATWNVGKRTINGVDDFVNNVRGNKALGIEKMSKDELIVLNNKIRKKVESELRGFHGERLLRDIGWSIPRMGIGVTVMNWEMFNQGMWQTLSDQELGSHLFMSVLMTRHRGHWGKDGTVFGGKSNSAYLAEYGPYKRALKMMGSSPEVVSNHIKMMDYLDPVVSMGDYISSGRVGPEISKVFDDVLNDPNITAVGVGDFKHSDHKRVAQFLSLYNAQKRAELGPDYTPIRVENMSREALNRIGDRLDRIVVERGEGGARDVLIKDIGFAGTLPKITKDGQAAVVDIYTKMLKELSDRFGFEVLIDKEGNISAYEVKGREGQDLGQAQIFNDVIRNLDLLNILTIRQKAESKTLDDLRKDSKLSDSEFDLQSFKVIEKYMNIMSRKFGDKSIVLEANDNSIIQFLKYARDVEANDRLFKIVEGTSANREDANLTTIMDKLFLLKNGRYARDIANYKIVDYDKESKDPKQIEKNDRVDESVAFLRTIFNMRSMHLGKEAGPTREREPGAKQIKSSEIIEIANYFKSIAKTMPKTKIGELDLVKELFVERMLETQGLDRRAVGLASYLMDNGLTIFRDGKLQIPEADVLVKEFKKRRGEQGVSDKEEAELRRAMKMIKDSLGSTAESGSIIISDKAEMFKDVVNIERYIDAYRLLGNEAVHDVLNKAEIALDKLSGQTSGLRGELREVFADIELLTKKLNGADIKGIDDPIGKLGEMNEKLNKIIGASKEKGENYTELVEIQQKLTQLIEYHNKGLEAVIDQKTKLPREDDPFGVIEFYTEPIQKKINKLTEREMSAIDDVSRLINRITNLTFQGQKNLGLSPAQVQIIVENLSARLSNTIKGLDKKGGQAVLSEVIKDLAENSLVSDALKVIKEIDVQIDKELIIGNEKNPFHREAVEMMKAMEKANQTEEHHRSIQEILKDYDLIDATGNIDAHFRAELTKSPFAAMAIIRDKIKANATVDGKLNTSEFKSKWSHFSLTYSMELMNTVANSSPINTVRFKGVAPGGEQRSVMEFTGNVSNINSPGTAYFKKKGYTVHFIDDTMSIDAGGDKLRNVSIDTVKDPNQVQRWINDAIRRGDTEALFKSLKEQDPSLTLEAVRDMVNSITQGSEGAISNHFFYVRLSPRNKLLFVATEKNIAKLNNEFTDWYNRTLKRYQDLDIKNKSKLATTFEDAFGHLIGKTTNVRDIVNIKLMAPYLTHSGKRSEFDLFIGEMSGRGREKILAKIQNNMFKRGFLSDGGTTQPLNKEVIRWARRDHPDAKVREAAKAILSKSKNGKFRSLVIGGENEKTGPLGIENIVLEKLGLAKSQGGELVRRIARVNELTINNKELMSLENSLLDGAKFVSERMMRLIMATKGKVIASTFIEDPNGAKTIIFGTGGNQMLGKGFMIYHPDVAKNMPKDVDMVISTESAKTFDGVSVDGVNRVRPLEIRNKTDWTVDLRKSSNKTAPGRSDKSNMIDLDIESIGVSFTSSNQKGVAISHSTFDFQNSTTVRRAAEWMGLNDKLKLVAAEWGTLHTDGGLTAKFLLDINEAKGNTMETGDSGRMKLLFTYGASPQNPIVQTALRRTLRNKQYEDLKTSKNINGGEDLFITPNVRGDLSIPLHVEIHGPRGIRSIDPDSPTRVNRTVLQFGGIGIGANTAKRGMGRGKGNSLIGESFIYQADNGIEIVIGFNRSDGKFYAETPSLDALKASNADPKLGTNKGKLFIKGIDKNGREVQYKEKDLEISDKELLKVELALKELDNLAIQHSLTLNDVINLMKGKKVSSRDPNSLNNLVSLKASTVKAGILKKVWVAGMGNAIPAIGHDKVILKIEKVLENMNGLTEINSHDLRTVLQRDNDGDHFYFHTRYPRSIMRQFLREAGKKDDFRMWDASNNLTLESINIFGLNKETVGDREVMRAGSGVKSHQAGFHQYANRIHSSKMIIGQVIGLRSALSWASEMQLSYKGEQLFKKFTNIANKNNDNWAFLDKMYDMFQNSVDIHDGIHDVFQKTQQLKDFLLFDIMESGMRSEYITAQREGRGDPNLMRHIGQEGVNSSDKTIMSGMSKDFGKKAIEREIVYAIFRALRAPNKVFGGTYDEVGQRKPEPWELKKDHSKMERLFADPSAYIAEAVRNRISYYRKYGTDAQKASADELVAQYVDMFYGEGYASYNKPDTRNELYKNIIKGKRDKFIYRNFKWDNIVSGTSGFDFSVSGKIFDGLVKTPAFHEKNFDGIKNPSKKINNALGYFVRNIESFVAEARIFNDEGRLIDATRLEDINVESFGNPHVTQGKPGELSKAIHKGILRDVVEKQYIGILSTIAGFRSENKGFMDPYKIQKLQDRAINLQKAMDILDVQIAKDIAVKKSGKTNNKENIWKPKNLGKQKFNRANSKSKNKVAVFKVKGDVRPDPLAKTVDGSIPTKPDNVYDHILDWKGTRSRVDNSQLEFVGYYKYGDRIVYEANYTYVVDTKPVSRASVSSVELKYGNALFEVTYGGHKKSPSLFIKDENKLDSFVEAAIDLRKSISYSYSKTLDKAFDQRTLLNETFLIDKTIEWEKIRRFVEQWSPEVVDNVPGEPKDFLLNYLIQPQIVPTRLQVQKGYEVPVYKTNDHLIKTIFDYAEANGRGDWVKKIVSDWESVASGREMKGPIERDAYKTDNYNFDRLGDMAGTWKYLSRWLGTFYAHPYLTNILNKEILTSRDRKIDTIDPTTGSFERINVRDWKDYRNMNVVKEILKNELGQDC